MPFFINFALCGTTYATQCKVIMIYIDIMLPVPLDGLFTYSVPPELEDKAEQGRRVLVPFGRNKTYVGLIIRRHGDKPAFAIKAIKMVLDDTPVVTGAQLKLWQWIAGYYMAAPGDVMQAALPGGLKTAGTYKPKTETYLALAPALRDGNTLHAAMGMLARAVEQRRTMDCFLALTGHGTGGTATGAGHAECIFPSFRSTSLRATAPHSWRRRLILSCRKLPFVLR